MIPSGGASLKAGVPAGLICGYTSGVTLGFCGVKVVVAD